MRNMHVENMKTADIYGLTAEEFSLGRDNVTIVGQMIQAGIRMIQYREKEKKARAMYEECLKIRKLTHSAGVTFIVNDHVDLAMAVDADGVHIGQGDLPPEAVRKLIGPDKILGLSTHAPAEARQALQSGVVDYIGVGPVFATKTKKDVSAPVGLDYLDYVVHNIDLPCVAIGGIKIDNIREVVNHGVKTIAMVTEIVGAEDIVSRVRTIRAAMA
jgi:thiamine-phosphate pyrophosphorylase